MGFTVLNIIYIEYGACLPVLGARSAHLSVEDLGERGHGLYHDIFRAKLPLTIFKRMVVPRVARATFAPSAVFPTTRMAAR